MEFQWSCFKSWKMMLWKCCTQYASKFGKLNNGHRTGKGQFSFQSQRKAMPKNVQTTTQLHSFHTSKAMLKIPQRGFNSTWTENFQMYKLNSVKSETRDQIVNIHWIIDKARKFRKNICFIDYVKAFDCVENSSRDGNIRPPYLPPEKLVC